MASPVKRLQESSRSQTKSSKKNIDIKHPLAQGKMDAADLKAFFKTFSCKGLIYIPGVLKAAQLMKFSKDQLAMIELALRLMTVREDDFAS